MGNELMAGTGIVDISPPKGVELAGYPHFLRHNTGVHDPLYASCLYLSYGGESILVAAMDLLFMSKKYISSLKKSISQKTGVAEENMLFLCSHTHSGPWASGRLDQEALEKDLKPDVGYIEKLLNDIEIMMISAAKDTFEAEIGFGVGKCGSEQGVGGNRRDPNGPCDPQVTVLGVKDMSGKWRACLNGYALHPTFLHGESTVVSADYPGYIRKYLSWAKKDMVLLFGQGTSGNQSSRYFRDGQNFEEACRVGTTIGVEVNRVLDNMTSIDNPRIFVKTKAVDTTLRKLPDIHAAEKSVKAAESQLDELKKQKAKYIDIRNAELKLLGAEDILGYAKLDAQGIKPELLTDEMPMEVTLAGIGDIRIAGIQGEMFVEYGLEIKERSPYEKTMVYELCNGAAPGYIYTQEALEKGGYETDTSMLDADCGKNIVETAVNLLNE